MSMESIKKVSLLCYAQSCHKKLPKQAHARLGADHWLTSASKSTAQLTHWSGSRLKQSHEFNFILASRPERSDFLEKFGHVRAPLCNHKFPGDYVYTVWMLVGAHEAPYSKVKTSRVLARVPHDSVISSRVRLLHYQPTITPTFPTKKNKQSLNYTQPHYSCSRDSIRIKRT